MVGMHPVGDGRRAGGDGGDRAVLEPDIFALEGARAVIFGDDVAVAVVDQVQRRRRGGSWRTTSRER